MPKRKKQPADVVYIYSLKHGLGCPKGYCLANAHFLARYKNYLWEVVLESAGAHKHLHHAEGGPDHAVCGPGSIIFGETSPLIRLGSLLQDAQSTSSPLAGQLEHLHPRGRRIVARSVNMVIPTDDISWDVAETAAQYLMSMFVGLPDSLSFAWIDRDTAAEEQFHRWRLESRLRELASGALPSVERVPAEALPKIAEQHGKTIDEVKEHLAERGFEEQEDGSFIKNPPAVNHGVEEVFEARLTAVASGLGYTGEMFLSPTSWPRVQFVAAGTSMMCGNNEHRAWFGYLRQARVLVILPLNQQIKTEMYEIPGDPDFLSIMKPVVSEVKEKPS